MPVLQSLTRSSIDLSDLPAEMAEGVAQVVEFCCEQVASASSAETFETGLRDAMNGLGCKLLGAYAESRIERDGQSWFRVAATPNIAGPRQLPDASGGGPARMAARTRAGARPHAARSPSTTPRANGSEPSISAACPRAARPR